MRACFSGTGGSVSPSAVSSRSQRSVESFFGSKSALICENISHFVMIYTLWYYHTEFLCSPGSIWAD